ncbi:nucleolar protein 6 [Neocloeon triangulifer]|uniref:nucleolar protein 6 n=1 Tax=Neocloeon triangulifer TaxID=2078957 RepID=UPI00286F3EF1|nr:nucleolar protein 6 [Neocloeon triangulifer]XP_059490212.1 nucleolar protein 6 [Neocloeon triangulifer]XP_059490213.1 nucleolar protein 6 [Neocloeon triangulifer]
MKMVDKEDSDSGESQDYEEDDNVGKEEMGTESESNEEEESSANGSKSKKRLLPPISPSAGGESKKKKLKKELFKPPTAEEMTRLRETENLFHSNLFRLEIEEMMKEVQVKEKHKKRFQGWFAQLQTFLGNLKKSQEFDLSNLSWLKKSNVTIPVNVDLSKFIGTFTFFKPASVSVVGSYAANCCLAPNIEIDVRVEMPKASFLRSDFQNQRYILKRALYASYVASKLQTSNLAGSLEFSLLEGDPWKPILVLQCEEKLGKHIKVRLLFVPEAECFKMSQLGPDRANIKSKWATGKEDEDAIDLPSQFYNRSLALDAALTENEQWRLEAMQEQKALSEGIMLLKVWLKQRGLDQGFGAFSGYIISMYIAHLLKTRKLSAVMSSYQVVRNAWNYLAKEDWTTNGISLCQSSTGPSIEDFHLLYDVVFVDVTGYVNICGNMSKETFLQVKQESSVAIKCLDNHNINSFTALFMTKMPFYRQFDHILSIEASSVKKAEKHMDAPARLDTSGPWLAQRAMVSVLSQALGQRVHLICSQLSQAPSWSLVDDPPDPFEQPLVIGLALDPEHALALLTKGPVANLPEARAFREFWGEKSELRRFQDGSVCEAVVWSGGGMAQRRLICKEVVSFVAQKHLGLDTGSFVYVADQFESILELSEGENGALAITKASDALGRQLMQLEGLPLDIASVQGAAPCLRYSDPFPPRPYTAFKSKGNFETVALTTSESKNKYIAPIPVILTLALSSKWPEDLEAVRRIKAAFYVKLGEILKQQAKLISQPYPTHIDVLKEGFVFRMQVYHAREISLLKEMTTPQGLIKYKDTEESLALEMKYQHLPKLTSALHGLHMTYPSLGPASCLAKRWVSSHLLLDETLMPETCVELLMASTYLTPEPYQPPMQPQTAFIRFLQMLAKGPWTSEPIILNFREELKRPEIVEIENRFNSERSTLPPLFIVTPETRSGTVWTKHAPSSQILYRLTQLAKASLQTFDNELLSNENLDYKLIFRTPMNIFDIVIDLQPHCLRREESLDAVQPDRSKATQIGDRIPVVGLDLVQCFLQELRDTYSDHALFFCDRHGGSQIGVLFKPNVLQTQEFRVSHVNGHIPKPPKQMELSKDVFVEDVKILGEGIVKSITVKE